MFNVQELGATPPCPSCNGPTALHVVIEGVLRTDFSDVHDNIDVPCVVRGDFVNTVFGRDILALIQAHGQHSFAFVSELMRSISGVYTVANGVLTSFQVRE